MKLQIFILTVIHILSAGLEASQTRFGDDFVDTDETYAFNIPVPEQDQGDQNFLFKSIMPPEQEITEPHHQDNRTESTEHVDTFALPPTFGGRRKRSRSEMEQAYFGDEDANEEHEDGFTPPPSQMPRQEGDVNVHDRTVDSPSADLDHDLVGIAVEAKFNSEELKEIRAGVRNNLSEEVKSIYQMMLDFKAEHGKYPTASEILSQIDSTMTRKELNNRVSNLKKKEGRVILARISDDQRRDLFKFVHQYRLVNGEAYPSPEEILRYANGTPSLKLTMQAVKVFLNDRKKSCSKGIGKSLKVHQIESIYQYIEGYRNFDGISYPSPEDLKEFIKNQFDRPTSPSQTGRILDQHQNRWRYDLLTEEQNTNLVEYLTAYRDQNDGEFPDVDHLKEHLAQQGLNLTTSALMGYLEGFSRIPDPEFNSEELEEIQAKVRNNLSEQARSIYQMMLDFKAKHGKYPRVSVIFSQIDSTMTRKKLSDLVSKLKMKEGQVILGRISEDQRKDLCQFVHQYRLDNQEAYPSPNEVMRYANDAPSVKLTLKAVQIFLNNRKDSYSQGINAKLKVHQIESMYQYIEGYRNFDGTSYPSPKGLMEFIKNQFDRPTYRSQCGLIIDYHEKYRWRYDLLTEAQSADLAKYLLEYRDQDDGSLPDVNDLQAYLADQDLNLTTSALIGYLQAFQVHHPWIPVAPVVGESG